MRMRDNPRTKETKCVGTMDRKSEQCVVPAKSGNSAQLDPMKERRCQLIELTGGKMSETPSSYDISTKLGKIANAESETVLAIGQYTGLGANL